MGGEILKIRLFSRADMETIHERSLEILEKVGIKIPHPRCLDLLAEAGAKVDRQSQKATFPKTLVEDCLKKATKNFILAGRTPKDDMPFPHPPPGFYARTGCGPTGIIDSETGEYRPATSGDLAEWGRVADALDQIHCCANLSPQDVPAATLNIHAAKILLENTEKHLMIQAYSGESLEYLIRLSVAVVGSEKELSRRPILHWGGTAITPLSYKPMDIDAFLVAAKYNIPIRISSLPNAGGTAPVTVAGTALLTNVELLGGVVLSQVARPGLPIMHNSCQFSMDMATGAILQASPEAVLASAASVQLTKELYGIPAHVFGLGSDALSLQGQVMSEGGFMSLLVGLAGVDLLGGAGQLEGASTASFLQLIIDNDVLGMVRRALKGVPVEEDLLATRAIAEVGPGGNYLAHGHTLKHCREAFRPKTFIRKPRSIWESEGSRNIFEMARERLQEIRKKHQPAPLPKEVRRELESIVQEADRKIARIG